MVGFYFKEFMADLAALQAQRNQILNEIQRRGGQAKAPGFVAQLENIDAQIRAARGGNQPAKQGSASTNAPMGSAPQNVPAPPPAPDPINAAVDMMARRPPQFSIPSQAATPQGSAPTNVQMGTAPPNVPAPAPQPIIPPVPQPAAPAPVPAPLPPSATPISTPPGQLQPGPFAPGAPITTTRLPSQPADVIKATGEILDPATAQAAEIAGAEQEALRSTQYKNPNQIGPTSSTQYTLDDKGNVVQTVKLSESQQAILDKGEGLTKTAQTLAAEQLGSAGLDKAFNPELTARSSTGAVEADRKRIEDILYSKMTRDVDRSQAVDQKKIEQDLQNKGIPYSDNPDSRYQTELEKNLKRYDTVRENARQSAVQSGGEEYQRDVVLAELMRDNDLKTQKTIRDQTLDEVGKLGTVGSGYMKPDPIPYQGANYDPSNPLSTYATVSGVKQTQQQIDNNKLNAQAQITSQEKLAQLNSDTQKYLSKEEIAANKTLSDNELANRILLSNNEADLKKYLTAEEIAANKTLSTAELANRIAIAKMQLKASGGGGGSGSGGSSSTPKEPTFP